MAQNTRSIDRVNSKKGQRLLAFFLLLGSSHQFAFSHEIDVKVKHISSSHFFYPEDWKNKGWQSDKKTTSGSINLSAAGLASFSFFDVEVSKNFKFYYKGSENVLYAAAVSEQSSKISIPKSNGVYSLDAEQYQLESQQIAFIKNFKINENLSLKLKPHFFSIESYQHNETNGDLSVNGKNAKAAGTFKRIGTRRYGYLVNEAEDKGWGWGLDVGGAAKRGNWHMDFELNNLLSQLRFSTIHYSNRVYNIDAVNGAIQIKRHGNFSMTGDYGHHKTTEKLPLQTYFAVRNEVFPSISGGIYSVSNHVIPWAAYELRKGIFYGKATAMNLRHLVLDFGLISKNQSTINIGIGFSEDKKARIGTLQAKLVF